MRIDPKGSVRLLRDPVHDAIPYAAARAPGEAAERDLIASAWLQRLHRIRELPAAHLVFPGATHTRFSHALGVMHLAGLFAARLHSAYVDTFGDREIPSRAHVVALCRVAGLLHDVGRSAFGHAFDDVFLRPRFGRTSEDLSRLMAEREYGDAIRSIRRSPEGPFEEPLDPALVAAFIRPDRPFERFWERLFSRIIRGPYSADRLDGLARDSLFCGLRESGGPSHALLLHASTVTEAGLTVRAPYVGALKAFLLHRFLVFESVHQHGTVRGFEIGFEELLGEALSLMEVGDPFEDPRAVFEMDDLHLHAVVTAWRKVPEPVRRRIGAAWADLLDRRCPWREAHRIGVAYKDVYSFIVRPTTADAFARALRENVPPGAEVRIDMPYLEERPENPLSEEDRRETIAVLGEDGTVDRVGLTGWIRDLPMRFHAVRVFARERDRETVGRIAREIAAALEIETAGAVP